MIISGAYGRDYKSKRAVLADWLAGKDFVIRDLTDAGRYINRADAENVSPCRAAIQVRYKRDTMVCTLAPVWTGGKLTGWRV